MWDTLDTKRTSHLSHDRPCLVCGHAMHSFLSCSDSCACEPRPMPGSAPLVAAFVA